MVAKPARYTGKPPVVDAVCRFTTTWREPDLAAKLSLIGQLVPVVDENTAQQIVYMVGHEDPQLARDWLSQNTDANTFALASIALDSLDVSVPTADLLQQLDVLGGIQQPYLLMDILQSRQHDFEEISGWLETTAVLQNEGRQELKAMFGIGGENASMYMRVEPGVFNVPFGQ